MPSIPYATDLLRDMGFRVLQEGPVGKRQRGLPRLRSGLPVNRLGALSDPASGGRDEATAARWLEQERQGRAAKCLAEVNAALARHRCLLQILTQEIQVVGRQEIQRLLQVQIIPVDGPPPAETGTAEIPAAEPAPANGKKPAP